MSELALDLFNACAEISRLRKRIEEQEAENERLKEECRWMSAKQFLPKNGRVCPVWDEKTRAVRLAEHFAGPMAKYPVWAMDNGEKRYKYANDETYDAIIFWYDLPEPPEAQQ